MNLSKLGRRLVVAAAAVAVWRAVRGPKPRTSHSTSPKAWPPRVRSFVRMLRDRGLPVTSVRREEAYGPPRWVVEWGRGRSLVFPDLEDE